MTDTTEQKALALVNAVCRERDWSPPPIFSRHDCSRTEALCRAIEQHEAFRQEVSDAAEEVTQRQGKLQSLLRFIIPKPDPLVEVLADMGLKTKSGLYDWASEFRAVSKAHGYEWRKIEGEG